MPQVPEMKTYNKLVRDKIPQIIEKSGKTPVIETLSQAEYVEALDLKLQEEVGEYVESKSVEELADIEEVISAILKVRKVSKKEFEKIRIQKVKERGAFKKRLKLLSVED